MDKINFRLLNRALNWVYIFKIGLLNAKLAAIVRKNKLKPEKREKTHNLEICHFFSIFGQFIPVCHFKYQIFTSKQFIYNYGKMKSKQTYSIKYALLLNVHMCHKMKQGSWSCRVLVLGLTGRGALPWVLFIQAAPGRDVHQVSLFHFNNATWSTPFSQSHLSEYQVHCYTANSPFLLPFFLQSLEFFNWFQYWMTTYGYA